MLFTLYAIRLKFVQFSSIALCYVLFCRTHLIINVQNQGGDIIEESIVANSTDDIVVLEFQRPDGTLITQLIDFKNEVKILKAVILGEEERGQNQQYQVMCFVVHFPRNSFIDSDAISKLRQRNPGAIRTAEDDLGRNNYTIDYAIVLSNAVLISPYIEGMCNETGGATYTRHDDVVLWNAHSDTNDKRFASVLRPFPITMHFRGNNTRMPGCSSTKDMWMPCQCHLELCIDWYPCEIKYCDDANQNNVNFSPSKYRCGIKTCKQCNVFAYYVSEKQQCLWDELPK